MERCGLQAPRAWLGARNLNRCHLPYRGASPSDKGTGEWSLLRQLLFRNGQKVRLFESSSDDSSTPKYLRGIGLLRAG